LKQVLIIDDDTSLCYSLQRVLKRDYEVSVAHNSSDTYKCCAENTFDIIFLDYRLGKENGLSILKKLLEKYPGMPVVLMTAYGTNQTILEAMQIGAVDYLVKPVSRENLIDVIEKNTRFTQRCGPDCFRIESYDFSEEAFIGSSKCIRDILKTIPLIGSTQSPVFISGESGTGKEVIARMIHRFSTDRKGEFIAINCAAIPDALLESELFGHAKGAFTSAHQDKKGKFELADNGTLFLDEIGEMPMSLQPKLLRVLQENQVERIGANHLRSLDVRIISASNQPLETLISMNRFREDLFFRLNVIKMDLPPLRDRQDDIKELLIFFTKIFSNKYNRDIKCIEHQVIEKLHAHSWPGNIREFQNVIQRAVIFCKSDYLSTDDIELDLIEKTGINDLYSFFEKKFSEKFLEQSVDYLEKEIISGTLNKLNGHLFNTSQHLGISRVTLNSKIKKYGLKSDE